MSRLRVHSFSISLDGYGAGPDQDPENPLGRGGLALHEWRTRTRTFQRAFGGEDGATGTDDDIEARGSVNIGAWILGRNMFGPVRGEWPDDQWKGWWGDNPPYHTDVFVLTHHGRRPIEMEGGTTFHFVTNGIHAALERATAAAKGKDVRLGGGVGAIRQYEFESGAECVRCSSNRCRRSSARHARGQVMNSSRHGLDVRLSVLDNSRRRRLLRVLLEL
jgi:dihydrofolate reductase